MTAMLPRDLTLHPYYDDKANTTLELLGAPALNPFVLYNSSPRVQMFCSHIGQALPIAGATKKRIVSGIEREYGKYTFGIRMPADGVILKVIPRYSASMAMNAIRENPESLVFYEEMDGLRRLGCFSVPTHHMMHQHFGFRYVRNPKVRLTPGQSIREGTVIADSPKVDSDGDWRYGAEMPVAFMSLPQIIEDGVVISRSAQRMLTTKAYGERVVKWGSNKYPLDLYGESGGEYKSFPDIGDTIREDGLLVALREYDPLLAPVEMTSRALTEPDYIYDKLVYGEPGARIIDIQVTQERSNKILTPFGMEVQAERYAKAASTFYANVAEYHRHMKSGGRRGRFAFTEQYQRKCVEALADTGVCMGDKVYKTYRRTPLDEFRVRIIYEYDLVPTIGFKITGQHGDKGVVCDVWEDEWMPVDADGNVCMIIMDDLSTGKRNNIGRFYEHFINGASRDLTRHLRDMLNIDRYAPTDKEIEVALDHPAATEAMEKLEEYYYLLSPRMWLRIIDKPPAFKRDHLQSVLKDEITLVMPVDNPIKLQNVIPVIHRKFPQTHSPVRYRGRSGRYVTTRKRVFIATMYIMLLEKTGENWAAVSSAKLQHFGVPSKLTNDDKYSAPGRQQPVRNIGETEARAWQSTMGPEATADLLDQSTNPSVHKSINRNILRAENPVDIKRVVDRHEHPNGNGKPLSLYRHMLECGGIGLERKEGRKK